MLVAAETPVITIFGKSWDFHVTHALKVPLAGIFIGQHSDACKTTGGLDDGGEGQETPVHILLAGSPGARHTADALR